MDQEEKSSPDGYVLLIINDRLYSQGTEYWYCGRHGQWWTDFCPKCDPARDKTRNIICGVIAALIFGAWFVPFVFATWSL